MLLHNMRKRASMKESSNDSRSLGYLRKCLCYLGFLVILSFCVEFAARRSVVNEAHLLPGRVGAEAYINMSMLQAWRKLWEFPVASLERVSNFRSDKILWKAYIDSVLRHPPGNLDGRLARFGYLQAGNNRSPLSLRCNTAKNDTSSFPLKEEEVTISNEQFEALLKSGFFYGNPVDWKNWHLLSEGKWRDPGIKQMPEIKTYSNLTEPDVLRVPLSQWDENRALEYDIRHYPQHLDFWRATVEDPSVYDPDDKQFNVPPMVFRPSWFPRRDRLGLLYGDARLFENWKSWDDSFKLQVVEATNITIIPENGHRWQKFYVGPLPETMGWTMGTLLKAFAQIRSPGNAVVAVKINNMLEDTTIPSVNEDLLEIGLNCKDIALKTKVPEMESKVRVKVKGPLTLTAGMIEWPDYVELSNPEHYIAKLEEGGELDLEMKIEWGRGMWLADLEGLFRKEEGVEHTGFRRRFIKEVDEDGFYACSCIFGSCRMIRLAVHKLMGSREDIDRKVSTNPKEQLVFEVWTDASASPKEVLAFALQEAVAWMAEMKRQLMLNVDWDKEENMLKETWKGIDNFKALKFKQKILGGKPVELLGGTEDDEIEDGVKKRDIISSGSPISLPRVAPAAPQVNPLNWLKENLKKEAYHDIGSLLPQDVDVYIKPSNPKGPSFVFIDEIGLPPKAKQSLLQSGINTLEDVAKLSREQLRRLPQIGPVSIRILSVELRKFNIKF